MTDSVSSTLPLRPQHGNNDWVIDLCERGWIPDALVRHGMKKLMAQRLCDEGAGNVERATARFQQLLAELRASPIAIETDAANEQHYELPASFFHAYLGSHLKYSCCLYPSGQENLDQAEAEMLNCYAERAGLADGQDILELGCGWGSLSLWMAARYPNARITALSNSRSQREFIEARAQERGLGNLRVITGNIVSFEFTGADSAIRFDRVISIEMFEHMKNYGLLLHKVARWMRDDAKLFVHVFAHKQLAYHFENQDNTDWMSRYFFTGGTMPSSSLFLNFQDDLRVQRQWWVNGQHYEKTANHWLAGMDASKDSLMPVFRQTYGDDLAAIWFQRWRMFYMAVAELFGYASGEEWGVSHYLFDKR
jgi:cyclopropane-fatty-acyl-phospholipid synthase